MENIEYVIAIKTLLDVDGNIIPKDKRWWMYLSLEKPARFCVIAPFDLEGMISFDSIEEAENWVVMHSGKIIKVFSHSYEIDSICIQRRFADHVDETIVKRIFS